MKYDNRDQLRQALLELHYDLLEEAEAEALRVAIEKDPEVASEWKSILSLAGKIVDAACLHDVVLPDLDFSPLATGDAEIGEIEIVQDESVVARRRILEGEPVANGKHDAARLSESGHDGGHAEEHRSDERNNKSKYGLAKPSRINRRWSWATSASVAALAAMLGMLLIGSWYVARVPQRPAVVIRLQARKVPSHLAKSDHEFRVFTSRIDRPSSASGFPLTPASLSFLVLTRESVLFSGTAQTGQSGTTSIALPPDLVIPPDATLQVTAQSTLGAAQPSSIELPLEPTRCATYLTVDRPMYRPGETIYFRSLTLQRRSLAANSEFPIRFELLGPNGELIENGFLEGVTERGVGNGSFVIPTDAAAGPYKLIVKSLDGFFPEQHCQLEVRAYRVPRFKKALTFTQQSFSPGDTVGAEFSASLVTGEPLQEAPVQIAFMVGDQVIHQSTSRTSSSGTCRVEFVLPSSLNPEKELQLLVTVQDQEASETEMRVVPVQLGQVSVQFYPEGGYLVSGLENRVYFTAHDVSGAPVRLEGEIVDEAGDPIAEVKTIRDGMGSFSLQPTAGQSYRLETFRPNDVQVTSRLPGAVEDLPVMNTGESVIAAGEPLTMLVHLQRPKTVLVRMACRGQVVGERRAELLRGENQIRLPLPPETAGVVRVTILDPQASPARPLVERLVYRRPARQLQLEILEEASLRRSPGESVDLTVQVRNENGDPIAAVLGVSVVDDGVWSLDQHDRPAMSTQFLLLSEIENPQSLEHADFYLSNTPEAARSLDLLLGTQGWRRFISPSATESSADFRDQLIRLLELDGNPSIASPRFDNAGRFASEWFQYQQAASEAWQRLLVEIRILLFLVVFVWFAVFLIHRRGAWSKLASCLLLGSISLSIYGCGARQEGMVVGAPASDASSTAENRNSRADSGANQVPYAIEPGTQNRSIPSDASENNEPQREFPPALVDWLDDAKAAWLLRISQGDDSQSDGTDSAEGASPRHQPISRDELRQLMKSRGLDAEGLADELLKELRFPVRQYAHQRVADKPDEQVDLAETLYWQPLLITDERGRAKIRFDLPDTVTTFRIQMDGHTEEGRIGSASTSIIASQDPAPSRP